MTAAWLVWAAAFVPAAAGIGCGLRAAATRDTTWAFRGVCCLAVSAAVQAAASGSAPAAAFYTATTGGLAWLAWLWRPNGGQA